MQNDESREIVAAVAVPIVTIGADRRIRAVNKLAEGLLGSGLEGRHYQIALRQPALIDAIEAVLNEGTPGVARHVLSGPSSEAVFRVLVNPVGPAGSSFRGVLCTFNDVSDAEQIGLMRRAFVANVSHELRTPLTAILGFIDTLQGAAKDDPVARARFLAIMAVEAGRMNRLVSDLLSLSRVEAEERVRPTAEIDLADVIGRVASTLRPMAAACGVDLIVESALDTAFARADADQMVQVFSNLVENAIKYGGAGKVVTVTIRRVERDPSLRAPALVVAVTDCGDGIDALHLPRLTERFYRVDTHRARAQGGTGLGLAIVKHIVNRHRGRLQVQSVRGEGSTFTVILPRM